MQNNILQSSFHKYTHPFRIEYKSKSGDRNNYELILYKRSYLYLPPKTVGGAIGSLNISKIDTIASVNLEQASKGFFAILKIKVQSLQAQSAEIEWVESVSSIKTIELDEQKKQTSASIIVGCVRNDKGYNPFIQTDVSALFVEQNINTNLIVSNMVFNGVPVIFPVPFPGVVHDNMN
jgi:hypothetical protein